jgi:glutathione S-transferase
MAPGARVPSRIGLNSHSANSSTKLTDLWETEIDCPAMQGKLNLAQIALICAFGLEARIGDFRWRDRHPRLRERFDRLAARPSIAATAPPAAR